MKVSTKGRYGLRAMVDLAVYSEKESVSISCIAQRENISESYLEQLADREQTQTLGYLLKYAKEQYSGKTTDLTALMESLIRKLEKEGIGSVSGQKEIPAGMAMPRRQEIYACFNRF